MPTRRYFLQSTLLLPAALTMASKTQAQDARTGSVVFADFESGNYDGWTIEGDAFGTAPATNAPYLAKVRGYTGRGFVCSFHQRKGDAATGTMISKEFTIDKRFLTFRIGGGNHPNQACLNLIVDNQVVRTATGDGTANLSESSFDVSNLLGRKAHIEIVDATASTDRGYIMVDDIHFTDKIQYKGFGWRDKTIEPFFLTRAKIWQGIDFRNGESPFPFELSESDIQRAIDRVVVAMHDPDMTLPPVAERSVERIGAQIIRKVDTTIAAPNLPKANKFTRQWLIAEAVCEYARMNVQYDHSDSVGGTANQPADVQIARSTWKYIFSQPNPLAVCWGIAVSVRDLARATGLNCDFVNGTYRGLGSQIANPSILQKARNHGVVCFTFDGGIQVPSDVSSGICDYQNSNRPFSDKKTLSWLMLPRHAEAWELFLASFNGDIGEDITVSNDRQNQHKLLTIPFTEWATRDTGYLQSLLQEYRFSELKRKV